jgi:hypothetical protein
MTCARTSDLRTLVLEGRPVDDESARHLRECPACAGAVPRVEAAPPPPRSATPESRLAWIFAAALVGFVMAWLILRDQASRSPGNYGAILSKVNHLHDDVEAVYADVQKLREASASDPLAMSARLSRTRILAIRLGALERALERGEPFLEYQGRLRRLAPEPLPPISPELAAQSGDAGRMMEEEFRFQCQVLGVSETAFDAPARESLRTALYDPGKLSESAYRVLAAVPGLSR